MCKETSTKLYVCIHCKAEFKYRPSLDDHIIKKHPEFSASVTSNVHECPDCGYKTTFKHHFARHMFNHPGAESSLKPSVCIHCNAEFKYRKSLDEHITKKHPGFIASVSRQILECAYCTYKTTIKDFLSRHMLKHSEAESDFNLSVCIHCNATFKDKITLDDHIIKKHPDFIASVTRKIHECTLCTFKTTVKHLLARHMSKHPETESSSELIVCIHCNAEFKYGESLDDHIVKKHPNFTALISREILECTHCTYKTTIKRYLSWHLLKRHGVEGNSKLSACIHCNTTFRDNTNLDDHIVKKHPEFSASVTRQIYECNHCTYKTTIKCHLTKHTLKHTGTQNSAELNVCTQCNAVFNNRIDLDDHLRFHSIDFSYNT
ncbi:unnamed protein product [Acanthoscelides obtectus]|uniref:C2H2-type domain-containing protein n=1 Tax=Acanthoscelides obtectus TaxID=200917 RepID=A0A9P0M097_ACAOB|nr:unnamed protein product [Acanthoscelides obtectus]CAK1660178.1 Zinc finger protein 57 [Acanthoscelides obtectus]